MRVETRQLPEPRVSWHDRRLQEPGAGLAKRSRQSLWTMSAPTKFNKSVTSTSWTRRPRWMAVAIADHKAPKTAAPINDAGATAQDAILGQ